MVAAVYAGRGAMHRCDPRHGPDRALLLSALRRTSSRRRGHGDAVMRRAKRARSPASRSEIAAKRTPPAAQVATANPRAVVKSNGASSTEPRHANRVMLWLQRM